MASYDYDIANLALARLGQGQITSLGTTGRDAEVCNLFYTSNRDWCLERATWVKVLRRVPLVRAGKKLISAITAAEPPVVTCSGHVFVSGDLVTIEDCLGMTDINDELYLIKTYTSSTITLHDAESVDVDASGYGAYTSQGYVYHYATDDWDYVYDLPSGCLAPKKVLNDEWGWSAEYIWNRIKDRIYCNVQYASLEYVERETDVSKYGDRLVEFMAARLAWLICPRISSDESLRSTVRQEWMTILAEAEAGNADDTSSADAPSALWTNAR